MPRRKPDYWEAYTLLRSRLITEIGDDVLRLYGLDEHHVSDLDLGVIVRDLAERRMEMEAEHDGERR